MKSINPANGNLIGEYAEHTVNECDEIIKKVDQSWQLWKLTSFDERASLMHSAARVLRRQKDKFAGLMTSEMGKLIKESQAEVEKSAWVCEYYAENASDFLKDEFIKTDAGQSFVSFEPIGTVLAVMPWNFPFWQVFRFAAPALMAGNACVLKHASNVPGCALAIEEIFKEAGFPENLFRTLMIPGKLVGNVIKNDEIKAVTLTGSELAGSNVAGLAGRHLKKTVLELGGSDPFIVLKDADLEKCATTAVCARMLNCGQSCIAAKRFFVEKAVAEEFISLVKKSIELLKPGDPSNPETNFGPMARPDLVEEIDLQVQDSIGMGANLILGGKRIGCEGFFYEPTLITEVSPDMPVFYQETFGPVMAVMTVENAGEAIKVANSSSYGLGGCIWTNNIEEGTKFARQIESGAVFVNGMTKSDPRLPFGGIKKSGYGRELSHYGIKEFVNIKTIWVG